MMMIRPTMQVTVVALVLISLAAGQDAHTHDHHHDHDHDHEHVHGEKKDEGKKPEMPEASAEEIEYHKGSLCGYCEYCKFCKLCERDCPCEAGPSKPNCHMCKYCKYCYMCKVCDTVCQPGGVIDRVTSKIFSAIPRYNKDEIDKDIDGVKTWIDKSKEEL